MGITATSGLESPHVLISQSWGLLREAHQVLALILYFFSAPNCAITCRHTSNSIYKLLAKTLTSNGEGIGEAGLLISKILRHLSHEDITFFIFCGYLSQIIHPN